MYFLLTAEIQVTTFLHTNAVSTGPSNNIASNQFNIVRSIKTRTFYHTFFVTRPNKSRFKIFPSEI